MASYTLKGINDDFDTCSLCGKTGLKRVMWLAEISPEGDEIADPAPYGTTCGAKLLGLRLRSKAKIERKVNEMLIEKINAKHDAIMTSFEVFAGKYLIPADLCIEIRHNRMSLKEAQRIRVERHPILEWGQVERSFSNAAKFARFL